MSKNVFKYNDLSLLTFLSNLTWLPKSGRGDKFYDEIITQTQRYCKMADMKVLPLLRHVCVALQEN